MKHLYNLTAATLLAACSLASCSNKQEKPHLTIVHTNDTHSYVDPEAPNSKHNPGHGGAVERYIILDSLNHVDPDLLYLDAGDMVQGSPYFNIYRGIVEMNAMNICELTATTFGNHEFDNGLEGLKLMLNEARFPFVSANMDCSDTDLPNVKKYLITERKGVKIGITGVSCDPNGLVFDANWKGIHYTPALQSADSVAAFLKQQGCDMVVLLSHVGYWKSDSLGDRYIAENSHNIDLIVGGHTHTDLGEGVVVKNLDGRNVYLVQTAGKSNPIGKVDIDMTADTLTHGICKWMVDTMRACKLQPESFINASKGAAMATMLQPYKADLDKQMNQVIGTAPVALDKDRPQSPLGNLTADVLRDYSTKILGHTADLALMNVGGIRTSINQGDVTLGNIFSVYPFENTISLVQIKGDSLVSLFNSIAGRGMEAISGNCNVVIATDANHRTYPVSVRIDGKPIDSKKNYWVATIDYLTEGNDGTRALRNPVKIIYSGPLLRDLMIDYVKTQTANGKPIEAKLDNRVINKGNISTK